MGAATPQYFENCLESVARHSPHDIVAFYNFVDERDEAEIRATRCELNHPQVKFHIRPNQTGQRTGSLYASYNEAVELGLGQYKYISFIQADMQMMWWDERILLACDELRKVASDTDKDKLTFYTQLPVAGKRLDFYANWRDESGGFGKTNPGAVDVGIYPLAGVFGEGLRFSASEKQFSAEASERGVSVALHPYPFIAPIPFPTTARDARSSRQPQQPVGRKLQIAPGVKMDFEQASFHPFFMEDTVWPDGWRCLTPYWPTDTKQNHWFRLRRLIAREAQSSFLRTQGSVQTERLPRGPFEPGLRVIIRSATQFLLRAVAIRVRHLFDIPSTKSR